MSIGLDDHSKGTTITESLTEKYVELLVGRPMKKFALLLALIPLLVTSNANSGSAGRSAFRGLPPIDREVVTTLGPSCRIRMKIPQAAKSDWLVSSNEPTANGSGSVYLRYGEIPKAFKGKECDDCSFAIGVGCHDASDSLVQQGWAVRSDQGEWRINFGPSDSQAFRRAARIYTLDHGKANGWAVTFDDAIGEESGRQRHLHYCLVREPKAICGEGVMGMVEVIKKRPKTDLTAYVLRVLRTIELLDDAAISTPSGTVGSPTTGTEAAK